MWGNTLLFQHHWGLSTVFLKLHSIINNKIPLPSPETSEETLLSVFMLLLLVKIINIVGSSANRAIGHFVFGFYFVVFFHPMCCGLTDVTACNAQFADVTLWASCRCQDVRRRKKSKVYDRRPGAVAAQDEICGKQAIFRTYTWLSAVA